jgi:uncharacterized BrkB/YihY/UPF0761 family membrane protein
MLESTKLKGASSESKGSTFMKRVIVSFFLMSLYVLPMHLGAPFWILNQNFTALSMFNEFMNIGREHKKDTVSLRIIEWLIYCTTLVVLFSRVVLNKSTLSQSGFT